MADPGYILETDNIDTFLNGIASLVAEGGGDTPEPSIGAIIRAIRASEEGATIYVYTDAPPSDSHRIFEAHALTTQKSVTVIFELISGSRKRATNDESGNKYYNEKRNTNEAYEFLAAVSGGQVLNVGISEISELGELITFSTNQAQVTIFRGSGLLPTSKPYTFAIDSSIEQVVISINGYGFGVHVTTPNGMDAYIYNDTVTVVTDWE